MREGQVQLRSGMGAGARNVTVVCIGVMIGSCYVVAAGALGWTVAELTKAEPSLKMLIWGLVVAVAALTAITLYKRDEDYD